MANYTDLKTLFTDMANAIRAKNGSTSTIIADNFPAEIEALRTGFDYNNQSVISIPDYAFYDCEDLKSVNCHSLTSVGISAFENCKSLESVILYDGVTEVGENAFKGCSDDLIIYCMFESQPDTWHKNWNPDGCEVVWCGGVVETWDISANEEDSVIAILYNIGDKQSLIIKGNGNMKNYSYEPNRKAPWYNHRNNITSVIIYGVANIGIYAFYNCTSITSVIISQGITSIEDCAFYNCTSLVSINIPNSITNIGDQAFMGCTSITSITMPDSIINLGAHAFYYCTSLVSINIPKGIANICDYTFYECALTSIIIPNNIASIDDYVFYNCTSLASITIPNSVTSIGTGAFHHCNYLTSITYTGTITQWQAIRFGDNWNSNIPNYTIHCTDGDIAKDGTITYH